MKNSTKVLITLVCVAILGVAVYLFKGPTDNAVATSPAGSTFSTGKSYGVAINLASAGTNGTSTSITNNDASDRYVTGFRVACENVGTSKTAYTGTGLASLQLSIGTTTSAAPATFSSVFPVALNYVISTSTVNVVVASSTTQTATSSNAMVWPMGISMTFATNATNTAVCTVAVDTLAS